MRYLFCWTFALHWWWAQEVDVVFDLIFQCFLVHSIQVQYGWLLILKNRWVAQKMLTLERLFFFCWMFFNRIWFKGELACKSQASLVTVKGPPFQGKCSISSYRYIPTNFMYCLYLWFFHSVSTEEIAAPLSIFCRIEWNIQNCTEPKRNGWWHTSLILGSVLSQYSVYKCVRKHTYSIFIHTLCRYGGCVFA